MCEYNECRKKIRQASNRLFSRDGQEERQLLIWRRELRLVLRKHHCEEEVGGRLVDVPLGSEVHPQAWLEQVSSTSEGHTPNLNSVTGMCTNN